MGEILEKNKLTMEEKLKIANAGGSFKRQEKTVGLAKRFAKGKRWE